MSHSKTTRCGGTALTASLSPCETASQILQEILKTVHRRLRAAAVRWREDAEHVHQVRVSVRRALAAIRFFKDLIPEPHARWFRKKLKAVLRATRLARDLDVLIEERLAGCGKSKQNPLKRFKSERKNAQQAIVAIHQKLNRKDAFRKHIRNLMHELRHGASRETANPPMSTREWCLKRFEAIRNPFAEVKWGNFDVETLHRLRIKTKQLRYTVEVVEQATDIPNLFDLVTALTAIQQQLGVLQDHVAVRKQLQKLVRSGSQGRKKKNLRHLIQHEDDAIAECIDLFRHWSQSDNGRAVMQCLKNILPWH